MKALTLQVLQEDWLPEVMALDRACLGGLWSLEGYRREIASPNSDLLVLLTPSRDPAPSALKPGQEGGIVYQVVGLGCLWAIVEEAHITLLVIHPDCQQQGLGQAMLWALMQRAQRRGLERATLEVKTTNQVAIHLYEKFGFQLVGHRHGYYADTGEDALVLWRNGLHHDDFPAVLATWQQQVIDRLEQSQWRLLNLSPLGLAQAE